MRSVIAPLLFALAHNPQGALSPYSDPGTAQLIARARQRHARQDSLVTGYRARVRTRFDMTAARSRFARGTTLLAHESMARVEWRAPNDLRIEMLGARTAAPVLRMLRAMGADIEGDLEDEMRSEVWLDRPWFLPRSFGDSIRLMGVPELAALHPLAPAAEGFYHYAITDSIILTEGARTVRAVGVRVAPRRAGPSLVAGDMWIDADHGDLVRLRVVFLGDYAWDQPDADVPGDSARARRHNRRVMQYVTAEADVEYALHDGQYWMPYRQGIMVTLRVPLFVSATVPIRAITTFTDYEIKALAPLAFAIGDDELDRENRRRSVRRCMTCASDEAGGDTVRVMRPAPLVETGYYRGGRWGGGRWEVVVPPIDSLTRYTWPAEFEIALAPAEERRLRESAVALAQLIEDLPAEYTGRRRLALAWERASDIFRFNRVQGVSLGLGFELRPRVTFTRVLGTAGYGFADGRPTGSLTWRWDGPEARVDVTSYRVVRDVEPWTGGRSFGSSLNALFAAHDDADYYLSTGGGLEFTANTGLLADTRMGVSLERHRSVATVAGSGVNDALGGTGVMPFNPPVAAGTYLRLGVSRRDRLGAVELRQGGDLLAGNGRAGARFWGTMAIPWAMLGRHAMLNLTAGGSAGEPLPQLAFRIGGPRSVRGYRYGSRTGRTLWAAQFDYELRERGVITPVVFADVGDTFSTRDPLVSVGGGVSILGGLVRFDVAKGIRPAVRPRFDLSFRLAR